MHFNLQKTWVVIWNLVVNDSLIPRLPVKTLLTIQSEILSVLTPSVPVSQLLVHKADTSLSRPDNHSQLSVPTLNLQSCY